MITDCSKEALPFQTLVCYPAEDPGRGCSPVRGAGHSGVLDSLGETPFSGWWEHGKLTYGSWGTSLWATHGLSWSSMD